MRMDAISLLLVIAFLVVGYWYFRIWGRLVRSIFNPQGEQPPPFWIRFRQELSDLHSSERRALAILAGILVVALLWAGFQAAT
jgi:Na+/H+ antiporter NhaD/arsenite permease-like protein